MYDPTLMEEFVRRSGSFERAFVKGYIELALQHFKSAKEEMKKALEVLAELRIRSVPEVLLCLYDLLSLAHLFCGEYFECMFYLDRGITLSNEDQLHLVAAHFLNCKLIAERIARIPGPSSKLDVDLDLNEDIESCMQAEKARIVSSKMYANLLFEREMSNLREIRTLEHFSTVGISTLSEDIERIVRSFLGCTIVSLYCVGGELYANDFSRFMNIKIDFTDAKEKLTEIIAESKKILKRDVVDDMDKTRWWTERIDLDTRLGEVLCRVSEGFDGIAFQEKVILVLDETTTDFPFESMPALQNRAVYRVPSLEYLEAACDQTVGKGSVFYLLDPENNLHRTRKTIAEFLEAAYVKNGVVGRSPTASECKEGQQKRHRSVLWSWRRCEASEASGNE
ncbi:separase [Biomphalaria pfeifferi]|uniref:separase n=1 Tax=Biomphalaria pfeifferi TaxID=112525 RepID=A0AAD8ANR7_BIOPF|nr:separase [Biomphalaria pfeifferi]